MPKLITGNDTKIFTVEELYMVFTACQSCVRSAIYFVSHADVDVYIKLLIHNW